MACRLRGGPSHDASQFGLAAEETLRKQWGELWRTLSERCANQSLHWNRSLCIIRRCREPRGSQLRSARCCWFQPIQKEDSKCNLHNLKSRSHLSKRNSAGASLESVVSSSNPRIAIRRASGIRNILDWLTQATARCFRGANTTTRKRNTLPFGLFFKPPPTISQPRSRL